jgi:hypothetical protein
MNNIARLYKIFLIGALFTLLSCSTPSYCECEEYSKQAVLASAGIPSDVDMGAVESCAKKVKKDLSLKLSVNEMSVDYINQVSHEMCLYGYYELRDGSGKVFSTETKNDSK